jgi:hypothetical protein
MPNKPATPSLFDVAQRTYSGDATTKDPSYYRRYDDFLRNNDFRPTGILEVGVFQGESTKVFATSYPNAKIVALDLARYAHLDFSSFPNVVYLQADQTDATRLEEIMQREFPAGFDLVIDDASHIGAYSRMTFDAVFPRLNPGGVYIVEDWCTGYWDDWIDGGRFQEYPLSFHDGNVPRRLPSHDCGMVGFVKSLVDMTAGPDIRAKMSDPPVHQAQIETLEFGPAICIALKARQPADNATRFDADPEAGKRAIFDGLSAHSAAATLGKVVEERDAALAEVAALRNSTSWALTGPLRALSSIVLRRT